MDAKSDFRLNARQIDAFRRALLDWYGEHQRDLPWRRTCDPYAVWVSEIMLQQTRVDQVRPYYDRFMDRFPTVEHLGKASLEDVLKAWEGMGYYARARNLHRAARRVVDEHGGQIPDDPARISDLPGIGPYTAAAISSIAFGRDCPVVDGNVVRVLSRLFHLTDTPASSAARKRIDGLAGRLLARGRAGNFNQAMMELGATICTPRQPRCGACPVNPFCEARKTLPDPAVLPRKKPRPQRPHHRVVAGIVRRNDEVLIVRRPTDGLLGGLWEFPGGIVGKGVEGETFLAEEMKNTLGIGIRVDRSVATLRHAFTHFEMTLQGYNCSHLQGVVRHRDGNECRWVRFEDLGRFAFPRAYRRLIEAAAKVREVREPAGST